MSKKINNDDNWKFSKLTPRQKRVCVLRIAMCFLVR